MQEELIALYSNNTWHLINIDIIDSKWVYHMITRKMAQESATMLDPRGFTQDLGLDYDETFSLVVKPTSICIILSSHCLPLDYQAIWCQNSFLYGFLQELVYRNNLRFYQSIFSHHVCFLNKHFYGLKQVRDALVWMFISMVFLATKLIRSYSFKRTTTYFYFSFMLMMFL